MSQDDRAQPNHQSKTSSFVKVYRWRLYIEEPPTCPFGWWKETTKQTWLGL